MFSFCDAIRVCEITKETFVLLPLQKWTVQINAFPFIWREFLNFIHFSRVLKTAEGDVLVDYSKNLINQDVMKLLFDLVRARVVLRLSVACCQCVQCRCVLKWQWIVPSIPAGKSKEGGRNARRDVLRWTDQLHGGSGGSAHCSEEQKQQAHQRERTRRKFRRGRGNLSVLGRGRGLKSGDG